MEIEADFEQSPERWEIDLWLHLKNQTAALKGNTGM